MGLRQGEWSQGQVEDPMSSPLTSPRQHVYRGVSTHKELW